MWLQSSLPIGHRQVLTKLGIPLLIMLLLTGCANYHQPVPSAAPAIALSASSFNFKSVALGQSISRPLHISNSGTAPLRITALSLNDKQFVIAGPSVPRVVLPNLSLDYTLSFTPSVTGAASTLLQIASNAVNSVASVSLSGSGENVSPAAQIFPSSVNFGALTLYSTASQDVTLLNSGGANIIISGITLAGAGFGYSNLSPGYSLAPNQSVTFQVWFRPTVKGPASGSVSILSANLISPQRMSLAGNGTSPAPPSSPPPAPASVQHTVHLTWNDHDSSVEGYRVYRSQSAGGDFQSITSSPVTSLGYDDDTVVSGQTYYYVVTAVDPAGVESPYSNQATAVVPTP